MVHSLWNSLHCQRSKSKVAAEVVQQHCRAGATALAAVTNDTHLLSRSQRLGPEAGSQTPNCYRQSVATGSGETR